MCASYWIRARCRWRAVKIILDVLAALEPAHSHGGKARGTWLCACADGGEVADASLYRPLGRTAPGGTRRLALAVCPEVGWGELLSGHAEALAWTRRPTPVLPSGRSRGLGAVSKTPG